MPESRIASLLKEKRKAIGLSVKDVVRELSENGISISEKTLYGWESGARQPDADTFLILCGIYGIKTLSEVSMNKASEALNHSERILVKKYRDLDDHGKKMIDFVVEEESRRMEEERRQPEADNVIDFPLYMDAPSAGNGNDLGNGDYEIISVPDSLTARLASYAVRVNGKSMEPELMDGDVVLVKGQETFDKGNLVVFAKNGDGFIKLAGETCFESINPDYPDIHIGEDDSFHVFGIVVGKL